MVFGRISLYFMTGLCVFVVNVVLTGCSQKQVYLLSAGHVGM